MLSSSVVFSEASISPITIEPDRHEVGAVLIGEIVSVNYKIINDSQDSVSLQIKTTCGCSNYTLSENPIPVGGISSLDLVVNTSGEKWETEKSIYVLPEVKDATPIRLDVSMNVIPWMISKEDSIDFGKFSIGETSKKTFVFETITREPVSDFSFNPSENSGVKVDKIKVSKVDETSETLLSEFLDKEPIPDLSKFYRSKVEIDLSMTATKAGKSISKFHMLVNLEGTTTTYPPSFDFDMTGILDAGGIEYSPKLIDFNRVKAGESKTVKIAFKSKDNLDFNVSSVNLDNLPVTWESSKNGNETLISFTFHAPQDVASSQEIISDVEIKFAEFGDIVFPLRAYAKVLP